MKYNGGKHLALQSNPELPFDGCGLLGYHRLTMSYRKKLDSLSIPRSVSLRNPPVYFVMDKATGQILHSSSTEITQEIPSKPIEGHAFQKRKTI